MSPVVPAVAAETLREGTCADNPFPDLNPGPGSLKKIPVPEPANLNEFVRDRRAAIILGKALFWDMQVGSDGIQSCASCHFRAGADPRSKNQVAPGGVHNPHPTFQVAGPNGQLTPNNFPLHKVADPTNRFSAVLQSFDDVISSAGIKSLRFDGVVPGAEKDRGTVVPDSVFQVQRFNTRRVEPRNTPTVINAAFNRRQLWDGSADHIFNGVNNWGVRDANARVVKAQPVNEPALVKVRLDNSALASQAVGPPTNSTEMSFINRPFREIGRRLLTAYPLARQNVHPQDSVLGHLARQGPGAKGLVQKYEEFVRQAFHDVWWNSSKVVVVGPNGAVTFREGRVPQAPNEYTIAEYNFSLFFGLALQMYQGTLISDDTPMDRFFEGNANALTPRQQLGLEIFDGEPACAACHAGAETTNMSRRIVGGSPDRTNINPNLIFIAGEIIERMFNGQCEVVIYDQGFYNIGVRPTEEDLGIGANDPFGNPLGIARLLTMDPAQVPSKELLTIPYPNVANPPPRRNERVAGPGAFKVPGLRNVALTAPYFHNGGQATLRQVVEFYNRGGDFRERNQQFIDFEIGKLNLTEAEIDALVDFLENGLTDQRVVRQQAPFDHPQLFVPNGHKGNAASVNVDIDGTALDDLVEIPAVGRNGGPLPKGFLEP